MSVLEQRERVIENRKTTSASISFLILTYLDPPPPVDVACAAYDAPTQAKCNAVIPSASTMEGSIPSNSKKARTNS